MRSLAKLSTDFSKAMASADRISEVLDTEPEIQDRPDAIEPVSVRGEIEFRGVSFDYGDGKDVLRQVSFKVAPGRSEEHTSELQSQSNLVCRLLLEKKKTTN